MRRITGIAAAVCLILGLTVLLYNPISAWMSQNQIEAGIDEFEQTNAASQDSYDAGEAESEPAVKYPDLLAEMQHYNEALYESGQTGLVDAWSYEQPAFDLTQYGLATDVAGVLEIPVMEVELPVYLGATEENMAKGAAVLGQTSMPVGGVNTNCVIAGHRGYGGAAFFREIEKLQPGDFVYLTTYWGEKAYQVESTAIILPDDMEAVLIQDGRELLTLVTCHPYAVGTHRYVVYCTAAEDGTSEDEIMDGTQDSSEEKTDTARSADWEETENSSSQLRIRLEQWLPFLAIPLVILAMAIVIWPQKKKKSCQERRKDRNEKNIS